MLKIHGVPFSAHTRKVIIAALEKGIPYEIVPVIPLTPPPGWTEQSALGLIPAIQDGEFTLADSSVICQYLDRAYPGVSLYPGDARQYARVLWIEEFVDGGLAPHVLRGLLMQRVFAPKFLGKAPDEALIQVSLTQMIPARFAYLEKALTGDWFVANSFSMADITVASILMNFQCAGEVIDSASYPKLAGFLRRALARPSFRKALQAEIPAAKSVGALDLRVYDSAAEGAHPGTEQRMFRIGEFSRIARVSARLLRYYDELGLLKPGVVDSASGYRFYTTSQLQRLNRILVLRDLGLTLEQIGGVIDQNASADQLRAMLELRRADAERALAEEAARLRQIEARIAQLDGGEGELDDVLIRAEPARRIVAVRDTVGSFLEARHIIGELARTLPKRLPRDSLGSIIGIAHSAEFEPDAIDVELGFVLNGDPPQDLPAIGSRLLQVRELPAVTHMAACVRVGLPEHAHLITGKIGRYVEGNGYRLAGPSREVFLRPPRPDRMEESVVEMQFPVERVG